jgi:hypothetical protein
MTAPLSPTPSAEAQDLAGAPSEPPAPDRAHGTVRLIPLADAESRIAGQATLRRSPERDLRQAHDRLQQAREAVAAVSSALGLAAESASAAPDHSERTRVAYERARVDSRRAELALRQEQRRADDAKLALRQAYEQVAHLEGMRGAPVIDLSA